MKIDEFIDATLIREIGAILEHGHHYISFSLIAQGIELLGACLDDYDFGQSGLSETRFNRAINCLFPDEYHEFINRSPYDLYSNLRCGLVHAFIPKPGLELIQESERAQFGNVEHLGKTTARGTEMLVLVSQVFYQDFKAACQEVIGRIKNRRIRHAKVYRDILVVEAPR